VAVVQYTFTHKKYTDQHNETEYPEGNVYNNKNFFSVALRPNVDLGLLILDVSRSHTTTHHSR
jgi:hypothetical protein